ncbi:MAG: peptide ABC transporter substrate-binding protein [Pyrinomonadaceae bacterium]|nr:peptide ABC transporter substrate-binding protein [Pyrinomonadaceae bacterium]
MRYFLRQKLYFLFLIWQKCGFVRTRSVSDAVECADTTSLTLRVLTYAICLSLIATISSCAVSGENEPYFGRTVPPSKDVMRYVSGPEPESLDPQIGTGQVEQRIYLALFEGLVEYDPQTLEPIPAIAERWETNADSTEFTFYLRKNAKWSNGEPITARDFVYTMRRGLDPELASRGASQAYYIKNAKAYNEGAVFVQNAETGEFLTDAEANVSARLILPGTEKKRAALLEKNPPLAQESAGKTFVPVRGEDLGVEAVDDYTVKISLTQPVPFFVKILPYNLFRFVPEKSIEQFGAKWTQPENIVTSGAFKLKEWSPYDQIVVEKNPNYWDAGSVRLERIEFYPVEDQGTMMNLYKAGYIDATYNRSVPRGWLFSIEKKLDYQDALEASIEYYIINTTAPPMNDVRVRQAFAMAIDKRLITVLRRNSKPSSTLIPTNIFKDYPTAQTTNFNPEAAQKLLAEAGYRDAAGNYDASKFPIEEVAITYNTSAGNKFVAEIVQSQWKQNLGLTVPLKNMEAKTFFSATAKLEYKGFARFGYAADYVDPYNFLSILAADGGDNGTGWKDERYNKLLDVANRTLDNQKRLQLLAEAESLLLSEQPIIPLTTASTNWLKKPYIKGMYPNALTLHPWKFVYVERDEAKW